MKTVAGAKVHPAWRSRRPANRSQALTEFAFVLPIFLTLMCGVFDYGWMIGNSNTIALAAREAANATSRQKNDAVQRGLAAAVDASRPRLDLTSADGGAVITRVVFDPDVNANFVFVEDPLAVNCQSTGLIYGGGNALKNRSRLLFSGNSWDASDLRQLPFAADNLGSGQVMSCAEVFYTNQFVTPIGTIIGMVTPPRLYDIAFF
ncbi:MAG: TadE/TadG family type IV pilus assembly protein [Verrucomicrobiota bacterium]